jgi:hypothetical protein
MYQHYLVLGTLAISQVLHTNLYILAYSIVAVLFLTIKIGKMTPLNLNSSVTLLDIHFQVWTRIVPEHLDMYISDSSDAGSQK